MNSNNNIIVLIYMSYDYIIIVDHELIIIIGTKGSFLLFNLLLYVFTLFHNKIRDMTRAEWESSQAGEKWKVLVAQ